MPTQRYSVSQPPIDALLTWIKSGDVAIPEIQRPFVWNAVKVRNFLDSLFQGYPVGYLIALEKSGCQAKGWLISIRQAHSHRRSAACSRSYGCVTRKRSSQ